MKRSLKIIITFLIILFPAISYSADKKNIDVVLVIDSTGSMKKTDPMSLRIPASKLFVSLLDKNDRAGVISFDDSAAPLSALISLDSESSKNTLFNAIDKITSTGLHTNLYEAVNKGLEFLNAEKKTGRERIIVLMTDGLMDTGDTVKDRELLEKLKDGLTKMLIDSSVKVYAIAFTAESDRQLLEKVSKQTGGFYNLALTDKDFHVVFTSIFESLKTPDMLPMSENGFLIDKSVEEVTIVATKESPNTTIKIKSPDGNKYSSANKPSGAEWFVSSNFDMMTMKKPLEGRWEILFSSGKNNKAYVITNLNLQTNFNELYPLFGQTLDIRAWLEREGSPIKEKEVLEKIDISMELTKPDGETTRLKPFDKGDGIVERKIELFTAGNYKLRIIADGKTFQREKAFAFKVADVKESQEDIKFKQSLKKPEPPEVHIPPKDNRQDEIHWGKVIIRFIIINLVLGIVVLIYTRIKKLKKTGSSKKPLKLNPLKGLFKRKAKGPGLQELEKEQVKEVKKEIKEPAVKKDIKKTDVRKETEESKNTIILEEDQEIDMVKEIEIQDTSNEEVKTGLEPDIEARNDMPEEQEIQIPADMFQEETSTEDLPPQAEYGEKDTAAQEELKDETPEDSASEKEAETEVPSSMADNIIDVQQENIDDLWKDAMLEQTGNIDDLWKDALQEQKEAETGGSESVKQEKSKSALDAEIERLEKKDKKEDLAEADHSADNESDVDKNGGADG